MAEMATPLDKATRWVEDLHAFFADWFSGRAQIGEDGFNARFADRMGPGFINIQPSGEVFERERIIEAIRAGKGQSPDFDIRIIDVVMRGEPEPGLYLFNYVELQKGARNSARENARLSSALVRETPDGPSWLIVHETGLDNDSLPPDAFDF